EHTADQKQQTRVFQGFALEISHGPMLIPSGMCLMYSEQTHTLFPSFTYTVDHYEYLVLWVLSSVALSALRMRSVYTRSLRVSSWFFAPVWQIEVGRVARAILAPEGHQKIAQGVSPGTEGQAHLI